MNIRDYIKTVKPKAQKTDYDWRTALEKQGYSSVLLSRNGHDRWQEVHVWCQQQIGKDHYCWTGSRFWFENEHDAVEFALRWA